MALEHVRVGDPHSDAHNKERDAINDISDAVATVRADLSSLSESNAAYITKEREVEPINVARYGFTQEAVQQAFSEAYSRGPGQVLYFPAGIYNIGAGLSFSGQSVSILGDGPGGSTSQPLGTTFQTTSQNGAAFDFTGYSGPAPESGRVIFAGFRILGDGSADSSKKKVGIKAGDLSGAIFRDIVIDRVGGPCVDLTTTNARGAFEQDWDGILLNPPVNAASNDIPAIIATNAVGCRFTNITISGGANQNYGVSGAAQFLSQGSGYTRSNIFSNWLFSSISLVANGTLFSFAGLVNTLSSFAVNDIKATGSGNSYFRFNKTSASIDGGNLMVGNMLGPSYSTDPAFGTDIRQSNNTFIGSKSGNTSFFTLTSGVSNTTIRLSGAPTSGEGSVVFDQSGNMTNVYSDTGNDFERNRGWERDTDGTYPRFANVGSTDNGGVSIGRAGVKLVASNGAGATLSIKALNVYLDSPGGTSQPPTLMLNSSSAGAKLTSGIGSPLNKVNAGPGSIYMQTDGGAGKTLWIKESGNNNSAGWVSK